MEREGREVSIYGLAEFTGKRNKDLQIIDKRKGTKLAFCKNKFFSIQKISQEFSNTSFHVW